MQIPKVLLVNDDPASLFALESLLAAEADRRGYELHAAVSGEDALRAVLRHEFAVILLDVSMPGMDGFDTADAIRSHPRSGAVPIIFITAHYADEVNRLRAYQNGAADYLFTPLVPQIVQAKVAVFTELARKSMQLRDQADELHKLNQSLRAQRQQELERIGHELEQEMAERQQAERRAAELQTRDNLTGLLNRRSLVQQLEHAVATADRQRGEFALLFVNISRFRQVNDSLGHEVGDELLRHVAARLSAAVRVSDVVARLGGDEFAVLIEGNGAGANAARVAHKIGQAHARPFDIGIHRLKNVSSIGIALYPHDADNAQQLMKHADLALSHARASHAGGDEGSLKFFHDELNQLERERELWTSELRLALVSGQLEVLYQPQVDLATGRASGVEAQLHWRHPHQGLLAAPRFLADIQDRALLDRLDAWLVGVACAQAALWRDGPRPPGLSLPDFNAGSGAPVSGVAAGCAPLHLSLRLATTQLHTEIPARLLAEMRKHRLPAGSITLQLGEALLHAHNEAIEGVLHQLQSGGVRLALDDFGHAHFSLATCRKLGLDQMRIDAGFVRNIGTVEGGSDMVAAIVHLARALGMQVMALGVQNQSQLAVLQSVDCEQYQGDLFCPPLPAQEVLPTLYMSGHTPLPQEDFVNE
ncbi:putative bifunctional diguanylate cyclase/phosphodiesterase [Pseudoduganella violacea]|uniref:Diguanylate cyclase (GGDEF)-like protein n=1 Tax=Pseudoduganella violacea TaxID=1715466 RepID=A0A7W5BD76_9BURK|nr:diguanylate cyclase (GGDEF)-like protein [Pseudoduganella violacea]